MKFTWRELAEFIKNYVPSEFQDMPVSVYDKEMDEYFDVNGNGFGTDGVLTDGEPFLTIKD